MQPEYDRRVDEWDLVDSVDEPLQVHLSGLSVIELRRFAEEKLSVFVE
jgi:hypothetical protein